MEGPPLGPGGEDITWPDQVAPRGRKASSTRKIKPQTSNHFHLVCSPEFFAVASRRETTRKVFPRAPEFMDLKDLEFGWNPTSPPCAFLPCPFHVGPSLCLGKQAMRVFWATYGCRKPKSISYANANSVSL